MSTQFIACKAEDCPYNAERQCRSPSIVVDNDGRCLGKVAEGVCKSSVEAYVELRECRCESCTSWEERVYREAGILKKLGQCGFGSDLYFQYKNKDLLEGPFCNHHERQVNEPAFRALL